MKDFLLISLSTIVIALSYLPRQSPRQVIELRSQDGRSQRYSLALDDPRLAKLREHSKFGSPAESLAMLRWKSEAARFYAEQTLPRPAKSLVIPASFSVNQTGSLQQHESEMASRHHYWQSLQAEAEAAIKASETRTAVTRWPIEFGSVLEGVHARESILLAMAIGTLAAVAAAIARRFADAHPVARFARHVTVATIVVAAMGTIVTT